MKGSGENRTDNETPTGDPEVRRLLGCLQSLIDGQSAIEELAACGPRAIPPLREFLLSGRVTSVPQPRMWAVEALALLGARDVLIEYLQAPDRGVDAQLQFAEDAVRNTAGRRLGPRSRSALLLSAITALPNADEETPSSLCRRRSVLALLAAIGVDRQGWAGLRRLLAERDPELVARLAQIASAVANPSDRASAAARLVGVLGRLPWFVWEEAEGALAGLAPDSVPAIDAELIRRSSKPPLVRARDEVLRTLLRLKTALREFQ